MLRIILFTAFFSSIVICQQDSVKQITNLSFDCRNVAFFVNAFDLDKINPQSEGIIYEGGNDSLSNIYFLQYDSDADTFFNPVRLNKTDGVNRNPVGFCWYNNNLRCRTVLWEFFNGHDRDIIAITDSGNGWTEPYTLFNSIEDEKEIAFSSSPYFEKSRFIYTKGRSVFLYDFKSGANQLLFEGNDTISYSSPHFSSGWTSVAVAQESVNQIESKVVYREKKENDSTWNDMKKLYFIDHSEKPYVLYDWGNNIVIYETVLNNKKVLQGAFYEDIEKPLSHFNVTEDSTVESSGYDAYVFPMFVTKTASDFYTFWPNVYIVKRNDSTYIRLGTHYLNPEYAFDIYTKVQTPAPGPGFVGLSSDTKVIIYTIWEDSLNDKIQLFGIRSYYFLGDVNEPGTIKFNLSQNYPNPFNPVTTIKYSVKERGIVSLKVYDILGKEVATLVNEDKPAGDYEVSFNGSSLASGVYIYRMTIGEYSDSKKLLLLK